MEADALADLLKSLYERSIDPEAALQKLRDFPFHDMGFAKIDHHRSLRTGYPEVIFCQNKAPQHVVAIVKHQRDAGETVFGTRASPELIALVKSEIPGVEADEIGRCFWLKSASWKPRTDVLGAIVIASAGTADAPVTEEARRTVEILGHPCTAIHDVGVAGIHRLFAHRELLQSASVVIVVAGMEGALPSVVAGAISRPVIGVPTSVGYGAHLGGMVPLFAMINSCASGLTVVNIDNGFGAACAAVKMNSKRVSEQQSNEVTERR